MVLHNGTAGRCCLYRAILRAKLPRSLVNCKHVKGWVSNAIAIASRWPSMAPHRGASERTTSVYPTPGLPTCSGALPTRCAIQVASLRAFTCCNPGCPRAPKTIRAPASGQHRDHTEEGVVSQQWFAGSSSSHSPALSATCIYLLRGQKVANYHGKGNSTLSRKDCDLVLLSWTSGTADCALAEKATCAWYGSFCLETYDARTRCIKLIWCQAAMLEKEDRKDF